MACPGPNIVYSGNQPTNDNPIDIEVDFDYSSNGTFIDAFIVCGKCEVGTRPEDRYQHVPPDGSKWTLKLYPLAGIIQDTFTIDIPAGCYGPPGEENMGAQETIEYDNSPSPALPDLRVGLQAIDKKGTAQKGKKRYSGWAAAGGGWSDWAMDSNKYDPDGLRVGLDSNTSGSLAGKDIRLGIQLADIAAKQQKGPKEYTPWASDGGGWSDWAFDANKYDPDAFRVNIETRDWPSAKKLKDIRIGVQLIDHGGSSQEGDKEYSPWLKAGGGWSKWAFDANKYDPDGLRIKLDVNLE
ncbi:hypothetical protein ACFL4W_01430 [Planctomycetota bacterium]